jgi:hypothetical protein
MIPENTDLLVVVAGGTGVALDKSPNPLTTSRATAIHAHTPEAVSLREAAMASKRIQYMLASVFFVLGGWCVLSPNSVMDLAITPEYRSTARIVPILMGAFGAQAIIAGTFAAFSTFTKETFAAYGLVLLPFFVFDYWFYVVDPMLTEVGLLDALGNVFMLALCFLGWRSAPSRSSRTRSGQARYDLSSSVVG